MRQSTKETVEAATCKESTYVVVPIASLAHKPPRCPKRCPNNHRDVNERGSLWRWDVL